MGREPKMGDQFGGGGPATVENWECRAEGSRRGGGKRQGDMREWAVEPDSKTPTIPRTCSFCLQITSLQQEGEELSGQARCPFDATQSNVAVFAGVHLGV